MENNKLTGAEKVLYTATYEFFKSIGATDEAARLNAEAKIKSMRKTSQKIRKEGFTY